MDIATLKRHIYENNKIEYVLQEIGCKDIKYHPLKQYYSCSNYNGDNPNAINVKNNEFLNVVNWTRQNEFDDNSDLITLVQYNKKYDFIEAIQYICKILDIEFTQLKKKTKEEKPDYLMVFKKHIGRKCKATVDVNDIQVLDEDLLDDYIPILHESWYKDGIMPWTREAFGLCYSYRYKRVVIPMRHWLSGKILGFNKRTTVANYDLLGIKKYLITPTYPKNLNIYGLYQNYKAIKKAGYVVIYESERSVLKRHSLGDGTGVAVSGHSLSDEHVAILKGLGVQIVLAFDKDISVEEMKFNLDKFKGHPVYYIEDRWDLLGDKDSPADAPNKVFEFLLKHKVRYYPEEEVSK